MAYADQYVEYGYWEYIYAVGDVLPTEGAGAIDGVGGGAGDRGGGGGAGGYLIGTLTITGGSSYTTTVGAGGVGGVFNTTTMTNGDNSSLTGVGTTAVGGGYGAGAGASGYIPANIGGSGGGGYGQPEPISE